MSDFKIKIIKEKKIAEVSVSLTPVFPGDKNSRAYSTHDAARALDLFLDKKNKDMRRGDVKTPGFASNFGSKADLNTTWVFELEIDKNVSESRQKREDKKLQRVSEKKRDKLGVDSK